MGYWGDIAFGEFNTLRYGSGTPSSGLGIDNDFYIDTDDYTLYGPKTAGDWGGGTSLVGPQGPDGAGGGAGPPGADGRTILSGVVDPTTEGQDNDFYINTSSSTLFGPKATTWPAGVSLIGPEGPQGIQGIQGVPGDPGTSGTPGTDGKTVLNGTAVPTTEGELGDFYIKTNTSEIYGPKTGGGWGSPTSLVGSQGIQGIQGDPGTPGADGDDGAAGLNGNTVLNGTAVPTTEGELGDFYLKTDTNDIYGPKTGGGWGSPTSLVGSQGIQGVQGDPGTPGTPGADGDDGAAGADGKTVLNGTAVPTTEGSLNDFYIKTDTNEIYGPKTGGGWGSPTSLVGPQGVQGDPGTPGADGDPGDPGAPGSDGKSVLNGTAVPTTEGNLGDFYIKTDTNEIYGPKTGGGWGSPTSLVGPQGIQGDPGTPGVDGDDGATGPAGPAPTGTGFVHVTAGVLDVPASLGILDIPTGSTNTTVCIGNDSRLSDARTPASHASTHVTGGGDVVADVIAAGNSGLMSGADKTKLDGIASGATVGADWSTNVSNKPTLGTAAAKDIPSTGNASVTEVVYGSDTRLTDNRTPSSHSHAPGDVTGTAVITNDGRLTDARTPTSHAASHKVLGSDSIKLDELDNPTDVITLDVTTLAHGLCPKLSGVAGQYLNGAGTFTTPGGVGGAPTAAEYIVGALHADLSAERLATTSNTIAWDFTVAGVAKAEIVDGSVTLTKLQIAATLIQHCIFASRGGW